MHWFTATGLWMTALILKNLRNGYKDFFNFVEEIEKTIREIK